MNFNSSSFVTRWDNTRSAIVTKYSNDIISIWCKKSPTHSASINPMEIVGNISLDKTYDSHYHYNEIPWSQYVSSSRETPFVSKCDKLYKYSQRGNLAFRYQQKNQRGYSRGYRNSPNDYSDDIWASCSIQQYKDTSYYENNFGYSYETHIVFGNATRIQIKALREHQSNKFYSENIGEYQNKFYNYCSGAISASVPLSAFSSYYYLNTKKSNLCEPKIYGDANDSLICNMYPLTSNDINPHLIFNENWSFSSGCWGYLTSHNSMYSEYYPYSISNVIKHPCSGNIDVDPWVVNREFWSLAGKSGSFTIYQNYEDINIANEKVTPNKAVLRSYYSTAAYTNFCSGTYVCPENYNVFREPARQLISEISSNICLFSMVGIASSSCQVLFSEFIFSTIYPVIDEEFIQNSNIQSTQGLTFGFNIVQSEWNQGVSWNESDLDSRTNRVMMFPVLNFNPDGNIKIIYGDEYLNAYFKNTGYKWENNKIYKVSVLANCFDKVDGNLTISLMINDNFLGHYNVANALLAMFVYHMLKIDYSTLVNYLPPDIIFSMAKTRGMCLSIGQQFFANIFCESYEEHNLYTIRDVRLKNILYNFNDLNDKFDEQYSTIFFGNKVVNRNLECNHYIGQLRKKISGTLQDNAVVVSGSNNLTLINRPIIYAVERFSKLFENNMYKNWFFQYTYFPYVGI